MFEFSTADAHADELWYIMAELGVHLRSYADNIPVLRCVKAGFGASFAWKNVSCSAGAGGEREGVCVDPGRRRSTMT